MSLKTARQAICIEILEAWVEPDTAALSVHALDALFDDTPVNTGELVRGICTCHAHVPKGSLFASLSRTLNAADRHADYFRSANYAADIVEHLAAHRAFAAIVASLAAEQGQTADVVARLTSAIREMATASALPEFLAEKVFDATWRDPVEIPLPVCTGDLGDVVGRLYASLCDRVGPVAADRMLARAMTHAESLEPAFDPRRLL